MKAERNGLTAEKVKSEKQTENSLMQEFKILIKAKQKERKKESRIFAYLSYRRNRVHPIPSVG